MDLKAWAFSLMEKDNRKSHLVPQMSPSGTHDLLRSSDSSPRSRNNEEPPANTPQYGEIPIAGVGIFSPKDRAPIQDRSPSRNGAAVSRPAHPGLGQRGATTNSIPQASSSNANTFNLPVRPGPPTSSFASQGVPQKPVSSDEVRSQSRRQPKFGLPSNPNPSYGV